MRRTLAAAVAVAGCAGRCPDIVAREHALLADAGGTAHIELRVPFARADALIADALAAEPLDKTIDPAALGLPQLVGTLGALHARVRGVHLAAAADDKLRFVAAVELVEAQAYVAAFDVEVEVAPVITATAIDIGFGPRDLIAVTPHLGADGAAAIAGVARRWTGIGGVAGDRIAAAIETRLTEHLAADVFAAVRATVFARLGERSHLHIALPDAPIASTAIHSRDGALVVDIALAIPGATRTSAPPARASVAATDDIAVSVPAAAAVALANWAIDRAIVARWYTRDLHPRADGEYRPVLAYVAGDPRPLKVHIFQERGGCSYFAVGMRPAVSLAAAGDKLEVGVRDRYVEHADASVALEAGLWLEQLVTGSVDRTRAVAASVHFAVGGRAYTTRVTRAAFTGDRFELGLALAVAATTATATPAAR